MTDTYPYVISNNRLPAFFQKAKAAARPIKYTNEFLKQMGFGSSNDRAIIPLLKKLGFLTEAATPTDSYDRLKDASQHQYVMGERVIDLYKDLFATDQEIHKASEVEIKGAFSRITGKDEATVGRYYNTFKALVGLSKFGDSPQPKEIKTDFKESEEGIRKEKPLVVSGLPAEFHYNIQIHLPATTDVSVYNSIFKSIRDNLLE